MNQMKAVFTLSLDCEGLWGMADHLHSAELQLIREQGLRQTYQFLGDLLQEHGIRASAAFVSAFAAGPERLMQHAPLFDELLRINPGWFGGIVAALKSGQTQGWDGQWCFERMRQGGHEMAWHGTTHQALDQTLSPAALELEMELTQLLHRDLNHRPGSIVFPRNRVGQLETLARHGFDAYRASLPAAGAGARVAEKLTEFVPLGPRPDPLPGRAGHWAVIAPGRFLHWPCGHRALVPSWVTVQRWKSMLDKAVRHGGVVHMWFHPHNLLTAPSMRQTLRAILAQVSACMQQGQLLNLTMAELAQLTRSEHAEHRQGC